jgi:hypothetical protein
VSLENRQKIPVPRRSFLWSLNETSGEILTHVGPTEFTPSANDRIVRANERGGFEQAPMEARPFVVAKDGEYVVLSNPVLGDDSSNGHFVPGGNKEKELSLGTTKMVPGPCAFPLWPGQSAEVRPAHKLGANHYLLVEVVGPLDEKARYYKLVLESAGLTSAVIDAGDADLRLTAAGELKLGQRIVIQGRHTQLFIPPTGIEIVPPLEEAKESEDDGVASLPVKSAEELGKLVAQVKEGLSAKQFSVLKNELRHRADLSIGERAVMLAALDAAVDKRGPKDRHERRQTPADPYARRAVVLGPKEFCILFDADGVPRIVRGPARVFPGPHDTFLQRGSRRRVYDAYELSEQQALWLRIITPISKDRLRDLLPPGFALDRETYDAGHELIVRGLPSVFFPFIEAEVIHPQTREPHVGNDHDAVVLNAVGIDQGSGIYVRDLRTGAVKLVRGQTSYLVDPRFEERVLRGDSPWAASVTIPPQTAVEIASRLSRRVEIGPKTVLLEHEEEVSPFLRIQGERHVDVFEIDSQDFVRLRAKLELSVRFEGEPSAWFTMDHVKLLTTTVNARVRELAKAKSAAALLDGFVSIELPMTFEENGMVLEKIDVLELVIVDSTLAEAFAKAKKESFELELKDEQASRRLSSSRHQNVIDEEEHKIVREAVLRKADSRAVDADAEQRMLALKQAHERLILEFEVQSEQAMAESHAQKLLRQADAEATAKAAAYEVEEAHRRALSIIERELAQAFANADATRLAAIQKDLVAALYAASDAEVLKAAASNMNLVSLLGGKSPAELLHNVVKGTPLERTIQSMRDRKENGA